MIDLNSLLISTGVNNIIVRGYGFKSSSGPAQGANASKPDGTDAVDWWLPVEGPSKLNAALPESPKEIQQVQQSGITIVGVPQEVIRKIAPDCGNNPTKKYDFTTVSYQQIEAAKVAPAVQLTFSLSGLTASGNTITGTPTATAKAEVFNNEGVNAYTVNIDFAKLTVTS